MKNILLTIALTAFLINPAYACDSPDTLKNLHGLEAGKLLQNAPTFRHGWEDGGITLSFAGAKVVDGSCVAAMTLTLPQRDIDEVNGYLDQNPAKRILLGAQGYSIPESSSTTTSYLYRIDNGKLLSLNSDNKPLNDLHHSLEFMYQLLAQMRAEVTAESVNSEPWPDALVKQETASCSSKLRAENLQSACGCRLDNLGRKVSARQMELINTLLEQPYSTATGALIGYTELSKNINLQCGLKKP